MTSHIKTASLTLCTLLSAACEYSVGPVEPPANPTTATTADASDDGGMTEPTGGEDNKYNYVHFTCYNESNYQAYPGGPYYFPFMHTCASIAEGESWQSEANMQNILDACSATCAKTFGAPDNHCENGGWSSVEPTYGQGPCDPNSYGPEYGGEVLWLDGVQSPERQVTCDLNSDCGLKFDAAVTKKLQNKGLNSAIDGDSAAENVSEINLEVKTGSGLPLGLSGALEYSTAACKEEACPFYLGRLDLEQTDSSWRLNVDLGALGRLDKNVSGLRVQLAEPTLGITLADGQVAFPADSLLLRVDVQLKGSTHALIENGAETFWLRNPTPIVGRLVDGSLDLKMDAAAPFGTVRIETNRTR